MAYEPTTWVDGENNYHIKDQDDNIILENVKLSYAGSPGTPVNAGNMNKIENALEVHDMSIRSFYKAFTTSGTFIVPAGVTEIKVTGCAAGGPGTAGAPGKAGEYLIDAEYNVTPGQTLTIVCGNGNTTIAELGITLLANNLAANFPNSKLGFLTGLSGGTAVGNQGYLGAGGWGGAFGFGGGGGTGYWATSGGAGKAYNSLLDIPGGASGVSGTNANVNVVPILYPSLLKNYTAPLGANLSAIKGGNGSIGASGSGGGGVQTPATSAGSGAAGGFGAGGGQAPSTYTTTGFGEGSPGFVLIEW